MGTKPRFRPSLRQYRILEAANKELKVGYDKLVTAFLLSEQVGENWRKELNRVMERFNETDISWSKTALLAFLLSIVTITCSAYQIAQWL